MPSEFDGLKQKARKLPVGQYKFRTGNQSLTQGPTYGDNFSTVSDGSQVTLTEGHPWPPHVRSLEDVGGPFKTTRQYITDRIGGKPLKYEDFPLRSASSAKWDSGFDGKYWPLAYSRVIRALPTSPPQFANYWALQGSDPASSESQLLALGTSAIARCKPTNSVANLSVALAELWREGLPKAPGVTTWEHRTNLARGASDEFLNTVFGWMPLVNDIKDVARAMSLQETIWRQYQRDAGRVVRRRYSFPTEKTTTILSTTPNSGPFQLAVDTTGVAPICMTAGVLTKTRTTVRDRWFSGAFTYYLPKAGGSGPFAKWFNTLQKARAVYGLTLDPEVVWNLAPWSWAADWFANTGDVLSNVSDIMTDSLVMHYGYIMEHVVEYDEYSLVGYRPYKGTLNHDLSFVVVRETKQRLRASPYGFGITWDSFSPKQLAILAALGISKVS